MKTVAIVQARMNSSRFPGKIMMDIDGKPMVQRVVERVRRSAVDQVIVATTTTPADDCLWHFCEDHRIALFRGDENDVLRRYYACAKGVAAQVIVRITADCPLIDPDIINECLHIRGDMPYCSNIFPTRQYPDGLDVEVFTMAALDEAERKANSPFDREHVTPWMQRHLPFTGLFDMDTTDYSHLRWTVDTPDDLPFICHVYEQLQEPFSWKEALTLA